MMATIQKQVRMVFDLNKCLGCQACTMACKTMWTDRDKGSEYMYWNNVETRPGRGYPKNWWLPGEQDKAGFPGATANPPNYDDLRRGVNWYNTARPVTPDYGAPWEYNYAEVLKTEGGDATSQKLTPTPAPSGEQSYAANWDEDVGATSMPDNYYFYLPRICNHCSKPACLAACQRKAIYKRPEDGIVLIDQNRCKGWRYCVKACPYKKIYFNPGTSPDSGRKSQKCIFCYPRLEDPKGFATGSHSFCFTQCVGRVRYVGYFFPALDPMDPLNQQYNVNKLIYKHQVAMQLHPEFGTEPNLYYIPPLSTPTIVAGAPTGPRRIPASYLATLFGDSPNQTPAERELRISAIFTTLEAARTGTDPDPTELRQILIARMESDRLQLNLPIP